VSKNMAIACTFFVSSSHTAVGSSTPLAPCRKSSPQRTTIGSTTTLRPRWESSSQCSGDVISIAITEPPHERLCAAA
jgi:hypothetical protein